jgi:hypothetical protein
MTYVSEYAYYFSILPAQKVLVSATEETLEKIEISKDPTKKGSPSQDASTEADEEMKVEEVSKMRFNWDELRMDGWLKKQDPWFPYLYRQRWFSIQVILSFFSLVFSLL